MKLEPKHVLPYGLCLRYLTTKHQIDYGKRTVLTSRGVSVDDDDNIVIEFSNEDELIFSNELKAVKPILRPLSDLTKEITHNGDTFVPIVKLLQLKYPDNKGRYSVVDYCEEGYPKAWSKLSAGEYITLRPYNDLCDWEYWVVNKLIEWKFAIDIPEGAWIDVNTLETNPYE